MSDLRGGSPKATEWQAAERSRLLRILGVGFGVAATIGATIGAGILRTPGLVAAQLGSSELVVAAWVLGGIYALLGANSIAELGASLPRAGGWYVYARRAFGDYAGFVVGWTDWLGNCASLAWVAITIGEYSLTLAPKLSGNVKIIAIVVLLFFSLVQLAGVSVGSGSQKLLSLVKSLAFVAFVVACFAFGGKGSQPTHAQTNLHVGSSVFVGIILALQAVITTYDGWYGSIYFAEEFTKPERDIPRSMFGGVLSIAAIYVLVNLALVYVLPLSQMAASELPVADAAQVIFGARSKELITILALVSLLGLINAVTMGGPRILFGLCRDYLPSSRMTSINEGGTPVIALSLTAAATMFLIVSGTFEQLLGIMAFIYVAIYITGFASLMVLRKREPELPRPFRAGGYPWATLIVLTGSVIFLVGTIVTDTRNSIYAVLLIAISYPVYLLTKKILLVETAEGRQ